MVYKILELLLKSDSNNEFEQFVQISLFYLGSIVLFRKKINPAWILSSEVERLKQMSGQTVS